MTRSLRLRPTSRPASTRILQGILICAPPSPATSHRAGRHRLPRRCHHHQWHPASDRHRGSQSCCHQAIGLPSKIPGMHRRDVSSSRWGCRVTACRSTARAWSSTPFRARPGRLRHAVPPVPDRRGACRWPPDRVAGVGRRHGAVISRTTTTASSASATVRSSRCRASTVTAGSSTSGPSPSRCCRPCGSASSSRRVAAARPARGQAAHRLAQRGLAQGALARFIDGGCLCGHIRRVGPIYRERHTTYCPMLVRDFSDHLEIIPSSTGLHLTARARKASPERIAVMAQRAADAGVAFQTLASFAVGESVQAGVVLGYGAIAARDIHEGLRRLRKSLSGRSDRVDSD